MSLCPGTKKSCPGVPLSRDKGRSKCPGTKTSVPGRPRTKRINDSYGVLSWFLLTKGRDRPGQPKYGMGRGTKRDRAENIVLKQEKDVLKQEIDVQKQEIW